MKILLDTHVWLWLISEPKRIGRSAMKLLESPANDLYLSAISAWEIAIKFAAGRLSLPGKPADLITAWMAATDATPLSVEHRHALSIVSLPLHHRDPFDRMLIAQARVEGMPIMTCDPAFDAYDVKVIRA